MANEKYYGEKFEGPLITGICIFIVLSMAGAWSLMSKETHGCRVSEYTYCGETAVEHH